MAGHFRRKRGRYVVDLDTTERAVLLSVLRETGAVLESAPAAGAGEFEAMMRAAGFGDDSTPPPQPPDPALARLLPEGHRTDPEAAADYRRLVGDSVRQRKLDSLGRAIGALEQARPGRIVLEEPDAVALLVALTDVRLVLADRLDLHDEQDADDIERVALGVDAEPGDERRHAARDPRAALLYDFLSWLQESLAIALAPTD